MTRMKLDFDPELSSAHKTHEQTSTRTREVYRSEGEDVLSVLWMNVNGEAGCLAGVMARRSFHNADSAANER